MPPHRSCEEVTTLQIPPLPLDPKFINSIITACLLGQVTCAMVKAGDSWQPKQSWWPQAEADLQVPP